MDKPADFLTVKFIGDDNAVAERTLFMSFGLLQGISRIINTPGHIAMSDIVVELRDKVLDEVFADRDPRGRRKGSEDATPGLTPDMAATVFDWAKEHVAYFLLQRLQHSAGIGRALGEADLMAQAIASSQNGSKA